MEWSAIGLKRKGKNNYLIRLSAKWETKHMSHHSQPSIKGDSDISMWNPQSLMSPTTIKNKKPCHPQTASRGPSGIIYFVIGQGPLGVRGIQRTYGISCHLLLTIGEFIGRSPTCRQCLSRRSNRNPPMFIDSFGRLRTPQCDTDHCGHTAETVSLR